METERRQHPRIVIKRPITVVTLHGFTRGETLNISIGGAFIRCSEVPELDENFRLTISCTEKKRLITLAREVWSKPFFIGKTMFCGMGVFFEYILDKDRRFLSSVMSKYL